jgi:hypothetical protein
MIDQPMPETPQAQTVSVEVPLLRDFRSVPSADGQYVAMDLITVDGGKSSFAAPPDAMIQIAARLLNAALAAKGSASNNAPGAAQQ